MFKGALIIYKNNLYIGSTEYFPFNGYTTFTNLLTYLSTTFFFYIFSVLLISKVYTLEISLGIFAFLVLLGIITVLVYLVVFKINDARSYAR